MGGSILGRGRGRLEYGLTCADTYLDLVDRRHVEARVPDFFQVLNAAVGGEGDHEGTGLGFNRPGFR